MIKSLFREGMRRRKDEKIVSEVCMKKIEKNALGIIIFVIISCIIMAIIETIIEPVYVVKSATKVVFFLLLPFALMQLKGGRVFDDFYILRKREIVKLLALGAILYIVIIGAYALTKNIFDYSSLVNSLSADQKVTADRFIWIALYISFGNSFLEEFMFRYVAFIRLSKYTTKIMAYAFSSILFAVYHVAMIGKSFPFPLLMLALVGLAVGGLIFDLADDRNKNIYHSWVIHMFADFAIMTIWYIHI